LKTCERRWCDRILPTRVVWVSSALAVGLRARRIGESFFRLVLLKLSPVVRLLLMTFFNR
jgi:hypothetical protein